MTEFWLENTLLQLAQDALTNAFRQPVRLYNLAAGCSISEGTAGYHQDKGIAHRDEQTLAIHPATETMYIV